MRIDSPSAQRSAPEGVAAALPPIARLLQILVFVACSLAFVITVLSLSAAVMGGSGVGTRDYVEYWASAQQLRHGLDPYDRNAIAALERSAGMAADSGSLVMGNAPPALLLVVSLGWLSARSGELVWIALLIVAFIGSVKLLQGASGLQAEDTRVFAYTFAPALVCIAAGQMSLFVLLGLALFLRFHQTRPGLAGVGLWLCTLKPQLVLAFAVVALFWSLFSRRWKLLAGAIVALAASVVLISVADHGVWSQYTAMMKALRYDRLAVPCLSIVLREHAPARLGWIQYLPAVVACGWALVYFWRRRGNWDWNESGPILILISLLSAPYTWLFDQCILLPAVVISICRTQSRVLLCALALSSAVIEMAPVAGFPLLTSRFYLWTMPAWCFWYWLASRQQQSTVGLADCLQDRAPSVSTGLAL